MRVLFGSKTCASLIYFISDLSNTCYEALITFIVRSILNVVVVNWSCVPIINTIFVSIFLDLAILVNLLALISNFIIFLNTFDDVA